MSMPLLITLYFATSVATQSSVPEEKPTAAAVEAALWTLLDSDADGTVDRYEAAAAAMAWADAAASPPGAGAAEAAQPGPSESDVEAESKAWFQELDVNADGALDANELAGDFELNSWRIFDTSNDRRLELVEFTPLAAATKLPATFTVEGQTATMRGAITGSTAGRFLRVLLEHRDVNELVLEFVPGSTNDVAIGTLLDLVHQSGVTIRVPRGGSVASGGSNLLFAGKRRIVEQGALVGIHSWAADGVEGRDLPRDHESHASYTRRFASHGIDPALYWRTLEAAPADGMHYMTEDEIHEYGVRTDSQGLEVFQTGTRASLRGLCGVTNEIAWATGSGATVLRTTDAGRTWANLAPASIAGLDVRDVFAISADVCWIMTAGPGESSRILFTQDGGGTWVELHRETSPQAFLDGLDAWDAGTLIAYGDPMEDGRFRVLLTEDGGQTWTPSTTGPLALESGEASFAASGTGVRTLGGLRAWIVTGGTMDKARVFWSEDKGQTWSPVTTPLEAKGAGAGAFSVAFREDGTGVIVGGDFLAREVGGTANAAWSADFGKTWQPSLEGPRGQRAGSVALSNGWFLATGQTGTDVSRDGGKTWRAFSSEGFHCVDASLQDGTIWLAGPGGRVGRVR